MKGFEALPAALLAIALAGCSKSNVNLDNAAYDPKITVEAYLYPGRTVSDIKLMRNVPLNASVDTSTLYLTPSGNDVTATINGNALAFDPQTQTYYDSHTEVGYGQSYTLDVSATINGIPLRTASTTVTPQKGFLVLSSNLGDFVYGDSIGIRYLPSPGTGFYAFSIVSDTATTRNFIYNNGILGKKLDSAGVAKNLNQYRFQYGTVDNINSHSNIPYTFYVNSRRTLFYGSYTVVAYACDQNLKDFLLTAPNVQEVGGNFHEPVEIFQGDGIGVFGSAIADTVIFTISK